MRRIEAYYCSICYKIIRADSSLGSRAVQRHCRSFSHLAHYRDHHPNLPQVGQTTILVLYSLPNASLEMCSKVGVLYLLFDAIKVDVRCDEGFLLLNVFSWESLKSTYHRYAQFQDEEGQSGEEGEGEGEAEGEGEGEVDLEEEPDQDKLWEEVDKGLTALQGKLICLTIIRSYRLSYFSCAIFLFSSSF